VLEALRLYEWPGNIRELQNFIERAVVVTEGRILRPPLSELTRLMPATAESNLPSKTLANVERVYIIETLQRTNWVVGGREGAAAKLGLPRTTLIARMRKLGISRGTPELRETRLREGLSDAWNGSLPGTEVQPSEYRAAFA
jgi:DNA-binding NtrC family response regulator